MYFQSTRPMMYQDLIKEMKAYEKGFGENHFTEDSLSFILDSYYPEKEEGREVLTFIGIEGFRISLYGQGGIGQNS